MNSLFEEQIVHESLALDHFLSRGSESIAEALTYSRIWHSTTWVQKNTWN